MSNIYCYNDKYDLIETKRGQKVYLSYRFIQSRKASTYVSYKYVKEALSKCKTLIDGCTFVTIDLGRVIGKSCCVLITNENRNDIHMLYRNGKKGRTPILLNGKKEDTQYITIGIERDQKDKDLYHVIAAYYGIKAINEPWDKRLKTEEEKAEAQEFWNNHALILASKCIDWERSNKEAV